MKFPTDRPVKVVMLGAGGTGGYVAPYVFRLLHMLDRPARFVVCDGDIVEPKNLDRQNFVPQTWVKIKPACWQSGIPLCLEWRQSMFQTSLKSCRI